jgi:hypothetical protein
MLGLGVLVGAVAYGSGVVISTLLPIERATRWESLPELDVLTGARDEHLAAPHQRR